MTALAGVVAQRPTRHLKTQCNQILAGQVEYWSCDPVTVTASGAAFGVGLFAVLPEDSPDRPPTASNRRFLLAADLRLDNREEIAAAAGLRGPLSLLSDAELLLEAWTRWGESSLDRLVGDFAFAIFDSMERTVTLARDHTGQRPLFYARSGDLAAFSSMPSGLLQLPELRRGWGMSRLAGSVKGIFAGEAATAFAGISRVLPGEVVRFSGESMSRRMYWDPLSTEASGLTFDEAVEKYRHLLDEAVRCRLKRSSGPVATQLSSGYDSSAVTATAAMVECGAEELVAFTAAPLDAFSGAVPRGRAADETALAAMTAGRYGLDHRIVHGGHFTLDYVRHQALLYQEPTRNLLNGLWASEILRGAAGLSARICLNGTVGNLTLNAGGLYILTDWLRQGRIGEWFKQASALEQRGNARWRGILFNSFAPWLPRMIRDSLWDRFVSIPDAMRTSFLRDRWLGARAGKGAIDGRPPANSAAYRIQLLANVDPGPNSKGALAESGIAELAPLADRRVVEFSLGLAPEHLLNRGEKRPVARAALSDRLPQEVLDAPLRGIQSADWQLHFRPAEAMAIIEEIETSDTVCALLDLRRMRAAVANWPDPDNNDYDVLITVSNMLPAALGAGIFVKEFESRFRDLDRKSAEEPVAKAKSATNSLNADS